MEVFRNSKEFADFRKLVSQWFVDLIVAPLDPNHFVTRGDWSALGKITCR